MVAPSRPVRPGYGEKLIIIARERAAGGAPEMLAQG
jgi:hypothetical protein